MMNRADTQTNERAKKLAIGVSSFRSDEAALVLVRQILELQVAFDWLFVVDSEAKGNLRQRLADLGDPRIRYFAELENIGSAGNLARRLSIGVDLGMDWLLALNHDAPVSAATIGALLAMAMAMDGDDWGALYPLRFEAGRDQYDLSGTRWFPYGFRGMTRQPTSRLTPVFWGSSNGALYSLSPVRAGHIPRAELWMGWEDYLYGIDLERAGWRQWLVRDAEIRDSYEFRKHELRGFQLTLADKPCWYYYYAVRNLLLTHVHFRRSFLGLASLVIWLPAYALRVFAFPGRCSRWNAFSNFSHGVLHGLAGRGGKWRLP